MPPKDKPKPDKRKPQTGKTNPDPQAIDEDKLQVVSGDSCETFDPSSSEVEIDVSGNALDDDDIDDD